ncbi:MAG: hypothetical protein KUG77_18320 [Nannocystaceae bacterium]|nr:hypothetical protein [Nannocystaceae bacterium]
MIRRATLQATLGGLEGVFIVNGVPLTPWTEAPTATDCANSRVAQWLRRGRNRLAAIIQRGRSSGPTRLDATLFDERGNALATLERSADAAANGVVEHPFDLADGPASRLWEDADVLDDVDAHRNEVGAALSQIRCCILDRDTPSLLRLRAYALRDAARLQPELFQGEDWTGSARAVHDEILSDRALHMFPVPIEAIRCEVVGDGRILSVWSGERTPPIRFVDDDGDCAFSMELHFARIGGTLRWVR